MDVIIVDPAMDKRRETFLRLVFGNNTGFFCIAYAPSMKGSGNSNKGFREQWFEYPNQIPEALDLVNKTYQGHNVWFCPQLFHSKRRDKAVVKSTACAWADLDECPPDRLHLEPSLLVESSPDRWQGYWIFEREVDPDDAENVSQRIAYEHAEDGADRSGWDISQLLRMPYTYNYKYPTTPIIAIREANRNRYRLTDWDDDYPQVTGFTYTGEPMPDVSDIDPVDLLETRKYQMTPTIWRLFQEELPKDESWSERLWKLELMLFEAGFARHEVFAIVRDARCNKYEKKQMSQVLLWKEVCRAHTKYLQNIDALAPKHDATTLELISDEERKAVQRDDTFIERYITWAKSLGDAAPQYHQAGAFTALSSLLAGSVQLPTSFGVMKPNLWFMILADTTLTRKSTAMDIAMDLTMEINPDVMMATDGSIEGLLTSLATRPSQPSVFLRDEFSGLLEMMTRKDYYAGMPELLTKLYDGKMQKRILRKETIDVRDPCLIVFAGGIKNKITSLLSFEHVSSGFMPRFIFITAESDVARVKPLGPPTAWTDDNRTAIQNELQALYDHYHVEQTMSIKGGAVQWQQSKKWDAELTRDAWQRYNVLETFMLDAGMKSMRPDVMTPVHDRLSKSILKSAVLLAASRRMDERVVVEEGDIVRAIAYGENWRHYAVEIMDAVGMNANERQLDNIVRAIQKQPGVSRSLLMQRYHLSAREASAAFETLEQRGLITRTKLGRAETFEITPRLKATKEKV